MHTAQIDAPTASVAADKSDGRAMRQAQKEDILLTTGEQPSALGRAPFAQVNLLAARRIEELITANRSKDEFLAYLCHELHSPLASVQHAMRVIHTHSGDTGLQQSMHALVERQVRHMMLMVTDLLDVSQMASRRPRLQAKRVDLCVIVCNAIATASWDIEQRKHRLTTSCPDCPIWLNGDAGQLEQVLVNLLINGSKYMDAGGELALSVQVQDGSAVVSVRDRGIGIAPDVLPHIFDLFVQADQAALRSRHGLGVGLALVRMIVDLHGGSVSGVSAGLGHGSEFTVRLPVQA